MPTVYHVLKARERPETWARPLAGAGNADWKRLGFRILPEAEARALSEKEKVRVYDTSGFGRSNEGHPFAQDWDDADVYAVIEFLKTVSGPEVRPKRVDQGLEI